MAKPKKPIRVYHHTPMVTDQFDNADLVSSQIPLPGISFHADPGLARRVQNWGRAPDQFFQSGIAAPPLGLNTSGIRNYTVDLDMDPSRVINLDVPLASQTREVRDALRRMGISTDESWTGKPLTPAELLWQQTIANNAPQADDVMFNELAARRLASGDYLGNSEEADRLANSMSFPMLEMLLDNDIPAATRKGPGIAAGGYYAPQAGALPNVPEFKVFNPDIARIVRTAAIPGAIAAGAATANASQEMGDRQIDALASSLPTAAEPLSREQIAEQAKSQRDLNARMSPKVPKRPLPDENSPFDAAYWQTGLSRHIQEHPPEFKQAFAEAMNAPVMRVGGEGVYFQTSVKDYLSSIQRTYNIPDETMRNVVRRLKGMKPSTEDDNSDAIVQSTLAALHQSVPGEHSAAYNPAVTDMEKAQWDKDANDFKIPASEVRYKLTKEGEQGYQAERVFNLLSTFQTNQFSPETSSAMSRVATNVGQFMDPTGDTAKLAEYDQSTPEGRMATALYWWNRGTPDGTSGDSLTGAKYPSLSSTTMPGIGGHLSNTDNYAARYAMQPFENTLYATDQSRETRQAVQELRDRLYRTTPVVPEGTTPEEIQQQKAKLRDLDMNSRSWASPTYAKMMRDLYESDGMAGSIARALADTSAWTGNPADKPPRPATTPEEKAYAEWRRSQGYESKHNPDPQFSYLSPMGEFAANLPRDYIDLASVFGVAAKAPAAAARVAKATRSLNTLKGLGELAQDAAKTTGKMAVNELPSETAVGSALLAGTMPPSEEERSAADSFKWLVTPQKTSPLMKDEQGNPVPADAPRDQFDAAYKRAIRDRNRAFRDLDQYEQTLQQRARASTQR